MHLAKYAGALLLLYAGIYNLPAPCKPLSNPIFALSTNQPRVDYLSETCVHFRP